MALELGYFAIPSPDPVRGRAFWAAVFGWRFAPLDANNFSDIESTGLPGGLMPAPGTAVATWFRVDAIQASVAVVRELGGSAPRPQHFPFGWTADCLDDQGTPFSLWQMEPGLFPASRTGDGRTAGEPAYFVLPSPDPERGITFYTSLFGWEFAPTAANGYRHVTNIRLPGGLARMEAAPVLPYFRVDDLGATLAAVREHGGSVDEPARSNSGLSVDATDNQGVRFHLWQPAEGF